MSHVDYPVCLRLAGRRVLLVGAGSIAEARAIDLVAAGAQLTVIAPRASDAVQELARAGRLQWLPRDADDDDVASFDFVFVATDDLAVSARIASAARRARVLVNTADVPALCDFTLPSVGRRGPITVAVSTSGTAPALARRLRAQLTASVNTRHAELARIVGFLRARLPAGPARMKLLTAIVDGDVGAAVLSGRRREAFAAVRRTLNQERT
ncbi:MAG: bifunctional precorrin-2 dehydrogenase/sirohydrochlorin ferrochelatase [Deltaproteobacteria bacterium]|nr:bifunctional precorrin-2 dehydrogenase/sirohydrochlorin ferrochelatase [Deltaproteobacteria bacterium]